MLRIAIARCAQDLQPLQSTWERLYRGGRYSIFQSPEWNLLAARVFAGSAEPMVVHAESDSGAAIIPACVRDGHISFLGDEMFDYRDVLAEGDDAVLRRAWQEVAAMRRPLSITALAGEDSRRQWEELGFLPAAFCFAPGVRAEMPPGEFVSRHPKGARLLRRLACNGVELSVHNGRETALVRHIYERKARQPMAANLFAERLRIEYMVAAAAMDSRCEIFALKTAGTLVAALLTWRDGDVRRCYTTFYEHAWAHYSPGMALLFEVTRRSLEEGLACDYMTGEQPHKTRYAAHREPLFHVRAQAEELARIGHAQASAEAGSAPFPLAA